MAKIRDSGHPFDRRAAGAERKMSIDRYRVFFFLRGSVKRFVTDEGLARAGRRKSTELPKEGRERERWRKCGQKT